MGVPRLSAEPEKRLREWVEDPSHIGRSVRSYQPTYANPAALRRDVTAVLAELRVERERAERLEAALDEAEDDLIAARTLAGLERTSPLVSAFRAERRAVLAEQEKEKEQ